MESSRKVQNNVLGMLWSNSMGSMQSSGILVYFVLHGDLVALQGWMELHQAEPLRRILAPL